MPLSIPAIANRDFDQLASEGRGRLPRLAPDWSDFNYSDPGITLMELLAARLEETLYRLDRTPPALARSFVRRVGIEPLAAAVAEAVVLIAASNAPIILPIGIQVGASTGEALVQTSEALDVSPAVLAAVVAANTDVTQENAAGSEPWFPFGRDPEEGAALYLGFDQPLGATGRLVRLYAWTPDPAGDRSVRARLIAEAEAMKADAAACAIGCAPDVPDWTLHYSVRTVWEFHKGGGSWQALDAVADRTRALSLTGSIEFAAPAGHVAGGPDPTRFFIRCRVTRGTYECPPRLIRIAHNAVAVRHAVDIPAPEALGTSLGHAFERYPLSAAPVVPMSSTLTVTTPSGPDTSWHESPNWDSSGPHDKRYVLDAMGGAITGGNGAVARVFPAGAKLEISYQVGGGVAGNLAAGTLARVIDAPLNALRYQAANGGALPAWAKLTVSQPSPAMGGAEAEDLDTTKERAFDTAFEMNRAVTCDDFERLARQVPAVPVARAHALRDYYPSLPCIDAAGCICVIVVPACPDYRPVPSLAFLAAVERYLDRRRPLTTEVHVRAPCYTEVGVSATLCTDGLASKADVDADATAAITRFFHPLEGGPEGTGWPIGRSVYRSEVMALLASVRGVTSVSGLGLRREGESGPECGNVPLCPDCLVRTGPIDLCVIGPAPFPVIDRSKPHECP